MKTKFNDKGFLEKLIIDGLNIIFPWGVETSDSSGFFSLNEKSVREERLKQIVFIEKTYFNSLIESKLPFSHWTITLFERIIKNKIIRKQELICIKNSEFNDFVSRYVFQKEFISNIVIDGKTFIHNDSRIKKEFVTKEVRINLCNGGQLKLSVKDSYFPKSMIQTIYIRDFKDSWIIHVRLLPKIPDIKQIKINLKSYDKAIPQHLSNTILNFKFIQNFLWYRGKRKKRFPISAVGLIKLKPQEYLTLKTEIEYFSN